MKKLSATLMFYNIKFILFNYIFFLVADFLFRLAFLYHNLPFSHNASPVELATGLLVGFRFDTVTFLIYSLPLIVLLILPIAYLKVGKWKSFAAAGMLIFNLPVLVLNGIDVAYFPFSEKRSTFELFILGSDLKSFSPTVALPYFPMFILFFSVIVVYILLLRKMNVRCETRKIQFLDFLISSVALVITLIGIRGGVQLRVISPAMAFVSPNPFVGHLGSNTAYNLISSLKYKNHPIIRDLKDQDAVKIVRGMVKNDFDGDFISNDYPLIRKSKFAKTLPQRNIILIVVESFNAEQVGALNGSEPALSLTPHFDALSRKGRLFTHYYSNAKRSIEAFPAILNSLPDVMGYPIITSNLETNSIHGIGSTLSSSGYTTAFFHGGRNGTMGLNRYASLSGFSSYYGLNEYQSQMGDLDYDGHWGIFDHAFAVYLEDVIQRMHQPYITVWFTLSNHHPYALPEKGWDALKKRNLSPYEKAFVYTDQVLGDFMEKAENDPAFKNTIFLITADHYTFTDSFSMKKNQDMFAIYNIPLLIYAPGIIAPGVDHRVASHLDLLPTVIDLLHMETYHASIGHSLVRPAKNPFLYLQDNGIHLLMENDRAVFTNFQEMSGYQVRKKENFPAQWESAIAGQKNPYSGTTITPDYFTPSTLKLKALRQVVTNSLIENKTFADIYKTGK